MAAGHAGAGRGLDMVAGRIGGPYPERDGRPAQGRRRAWAYHSWGWPECRPVAASIVAPNVARSPRAFALVVPDIGISHSCGGAIRPDPAIKSGTVAKVENRTTLKISRKLIFGLLCCCVAFQRHYGGP
jgi:hypothetical protein